MIHVFGAAPYVAVPVPLRTRVARWLLARWHGFEGDLPVGFDPSRLVPNEGGGLSYREDRVPFPAPRPPPTPLPGPGRSVLA